MPDYTAHMSEVSADELLAQLKQTIERLLAPVDEQRKWVESEAVPIDEILVELDDEWPLWRFRLRNENAIDADGERALDRLVEYSLSLVDPSNEHLFTWPAVERAPEWQRVRDLAHEALQALQPKPATA